MATLGDKWGQAIAPLLAGKADPALFGLYLVYGAVGLVPPYVDRNLDAYYASGNFPAGVDVLRIGATSVSVGAAGIPNNMLVVTAEPATNLVGMYNATPFVGNANWNSDPQVYVVSVVYLPNWGDPSKDVIVSFDNTKSYKVPVTGRASITGRLTFA